MRRYGGGCDLVSPNPGSTPWTASEERGPSLNAPRSLMHASGHAIVQVTTTPSALIWFIYCLLPLSLSLSLNSLHIRPVERQGDASQHGQAKAALVSHHPPLPHHRDARPRRSRQPAHHIGAGCLLPDRVSTSAVPVQTGHTPWSAPENQHSCRTAAKRMEVEYLPRKPWPPAEGTHTGTTRWSKPTTTSVAQSCF